MRKIRSVLQFTLALFIVTAFVSCSGPATKDSGDTTNHDSTTHDTTASTKTDTTKMLAAPFDVAEVGVTVKDYDKWKPVYEAYGTNRNANGMQELVIGQDIDNANKVLVVFKLADVAKAKALIIDPKTKADMQKSGVISKPDIEYFHIIRFNPNTHQKQWVIVTHKVKDFDAWLKVYDGEGTAARESQGMVDVALGRGIDDPSVVHIVFDITDMAKAKAAINSAEKKKLMISAGVIGEPHIEIYNDGK